MENEAKVWAKFDDAADQWFSEIDRFLEYSYQFDQLGIEDPTDLSRRIEGFTKDHYMVVQKVLHMLHVDRELFEGSEDHTACAAGSFLPVYESNSPELKSTIKEFDTSHRAFHDAVIAMKRQVRSGNYSAAESEYRNSFIPAMSNVFESFDKMLAQSNQALDVMLTARSHIRNAYETAKTERAAVMNEVTAINDKNATEEVESAGFYASLIQNVSIISTVIGVGLAILLGFMVKRSITGSLSSINSRLSSGAEQVNVSANQLSGASQSLAESSSEQAAGLEETSSSLEEISSQAKQNASNASQAEQAMKEAEPNVSGGVEAMRRMEKAMGEIQQASIETSKIIKKKMTLLFKLICWH
jgi:methyl-accepting chemotaxis protein